MSFRFIHFSSKVDEISLNSALKNIQNVKLKMQELENFRLISIFKEMLHFSKLATDTITLIELPGHLHNANFGDRLRIKITRK